MPNRLAESRTGELRVRTDALGLWRPGLYLAEFTHTTPHPCAGAQVAGFFSVAIEWCDLTALRAS
jgi:hypothetical protein